LLVDEAVAVAKANPGHIVGMKGKLSTYTTGGGPGVPILKLLLEAGEKANLPIMVSCGRHDRTARSVSEHASPG